MDRQLVNVGKPMLPGPLDSGFLDAHRFKPGLWVPSCNHRRRGVSNEGSRNDGGQDAQNRREGQLPERKLLRKVVYTDRYHLHYYTLMQVRVECPKRLRFPMNGESPRLC